jgi:hypothetical protein
LTCGRIGTCLLQKTTQPVDKPLAEVTKGNMSLTAERLKPEKRREKKQAEGKLPVNNRRDEVDKRVERAVQ